MSIGKMRIPHLASGLVLGILTLVVAACGGADPAIEKNRITLDEEAAFTLDFEDANSFEVGQFGALGELTIEDGHYTIQTTNTGQASYLWGTSQWPASTLAYPTLKNVVVDVDATSADGTADNWFGVICRAGEEGRGYAFLISDDGFWAIARTDTRGLFFVEEWRETDVIKRGRATNHIRAYCVDDYLALYVNDQFVGDHTDDSRTNKIDQVGAVGLLAGGPQDKAVRVTFDNLVVTSAHMKDKPNTPAPATAVPTDEPTATDEPTLEPLATLEPLNTVEVPGLGEVTPAIE